MTVTQSNIGRWSLLIQQFYLLKIQYVCVLYLKFFNLSIANYSHTPLRRENNLTTYFPKYTHTYVPCMSSNLYILVAVRRCFIYSNNRSHHSSICRCLDMAIGCKCQCIFIFVCLFLLLQLFCAKQFVSVFSSKIKQRKCHGNHFSP